MKGTLIRIGVSLFFIGLLVYFMKDDFSRIVGVIRNADKALIILSVVIYLSTVIVLAKRLQIILASSKIRVSLSDTIQLTFVGNFFNNFLPTAVGGDLVKAMCAARITKEPVQSFTSVLMDRIFGLFTFVLIPSVTILFLAKGLDPWVSVTIYSILAVSILCFFIMFNRGVARRLGFVEKLLSYKNIGGKIRKIYDELHIFKDRKAVVVQSMALSIVGQSVCIFVLYLMSVAMGADRDSLIHFFILVPVVHLISMTPSLGGLGIRENAYIVFLKNTIGVDRAAALSILYLGLLFLMSLIGGIIYMIRQDYHVRLKDLFKAKQPQA
ncbi:MAG: lysylphosphatidylglycerol synthase transmembrane domain-containing protein [Candidatus Omnitrophota bacterium]